MKITLAKILLLFSFVAVGFICLYIYVFSEKQEIFYKAHEIGTLVYGFSLSYLAATIFYFIVDYFPKKERKKEMLANLETQVNKIELDVNSILSEMNYPKGIATLTYNQYSENELKSLLENTQKTYRTNVNYIGQEKVDIITHMKIKDSEIQHNLSDIEKHENLLSTKLFKSLKDLQRMPISRIFVGGLDMINRQNLNNKDLGIFSEMLSMYLKEIERFRSEWDANKN